jgi:Protein of unknown function (DUF3341)
VSDHFLAEFDTPEKLLEAARSISNDGCRILDSFTPFRIPELDDLFPPVRSRLRLLMLGGGLITAAVAFGLQWYSAVIDYPLDVGGRPLNSWAVFLLSPFEVAMLAAALVGFAAFLRDCGLPRHYNPIFDVPGFERASQDRFFVLAQSTASAGDVRRLLQRAGALSVNTVAS